nr:basic proline-rich protein-like [Symphalangus syndactylus]XP_055090307.1 basic proline-rich protein-like [Symphalangus syndactylus]
MADTEAIPQHTPPRPRAARQPITHNGGKARPRPHSPSRAPPPPLPPRARLLARARPSPARRSLPPPGRLAPCVYKHKRHAEGPPAPAETAARTRPAPAPGLHSHPAPCAHGVEPPKPGFGAPGGKWGEGKAGGGAAGERPACGRLGPRRGGEGGAAPAQAPARAPEETRAAVGEEDAVGRVAAPHWKTLPSRKLANRNPASRARCRTGPLRQREGRTDGLLPACALGQVRPGPAGPARVRRRQLDPLRLLGRSPACRAAPRRCRPPGSGDGARSPPGPGPGPPTQDGCVASASKQCVERAAPAPGPGGLSCPPVGAV